MEKANLLDDYDASFSTAGGGDGTPGGPQVSRPMQLLRWAFPIANPGWAAYAKEHLRAAEFAGALGDFGTFLPMITLLAEKNHMDFSSMLFFAGVSNLFVGLSYEVPIPVQPMHAISAIAISQNLKPNEIMAAGVCLGAVIMFLGITNLLHFVAKIIPAPVVRGLQLGLGITLVINAHDMLVPKLPWIGWDSLLVALFSFILVLATVDKPRFPCLLLLFLFGIGVALGLHPAARQFEFGIGPISVSDLSLQDFKNGFLIAAVPQIPVTVMNSVIALVKLNNDLYPSKPISYLKVTGTIGVTDLVLPWFGAMPTCHGAGGLAAQHAFGARSNVSMLALGFFKVLAALIFGGSLLKVVSVFPASIMAVMLAYSGLQLAACARDMQVKNDAVIMALTAGCCMGFNNTAVGVLIGLCAYYVMHGERLARAGLEKWRQRHLKELDRPTHDRFDESQ